MQLSDYPGETFIVEGIEPLPYKDKIPISFNVGDLAYHCYAIENNEKQIYKVRSGEVMAVKNNWLVT